MTFTVIYCPNHKKNFAIKKNLDKSIKITRHYNLLVKERPTTHFSSKLPRHNFTRIWNNIDDKIRNVKRRSKLKHILRDQYLHTYLCRVECLNPRCSECN